MTDTDPYRLPSAPPPGTALVGPPSWLTEHAESVPDSLASESVPGLCDLLASQAHSGLLYDPPQALQDSGAAGVKLVLLHGEHLLAQIDASTLARQIRELVSRVEYALPVLLHSELPARSAADLVKSDGLTFAQVPLDAARWRWLLSRNDLALPNEDPSQSVRRQAEEATRMLHLHRRRLQGQVAQLGDELIQTQHDLESANRELTEHMSQLSLLYRFGRELGSTSNWDDTLRKLLEQLSNFVGAGGAALILRAAPGGPYTPRQTFQWQESAWDKVLLSLENQLRDGVAERLLSPGVYDCEVDPDRNSERRRFLTLPLEQQGLRFGYLLLLERLDPGQSGRLQDHLPFLQTVQIILAEEVASAQMLDRLREIGTFNARVLETVGSGIWVLDELGETIYCNRTAREMLTGVRQDQVELPDIGFGIGRGRARSFAASGSASPLPYELLRRTDQPELFREGLLRLDALSGVLFPQLLKLGEEPFRGEGSILRQDGESIPVLLQTSTMAGRGRDERWLVVVAEDLRQAKRLVAERRRADSLEGLVEMSAALAHEIRNPLMGLSAQAELLADQIPAGDGRKRYLDVITGEVERINDTISRLLNFVRPYEPKLAESSIWELARDSVTLAESRADSKGVQLRLEPDPDCVADRNWRQFVDAAQIKQVLLNLLLNAIDASPDEGEVVLRLRHSNRIELSDSRRGTSQRRAGVVVEVSDGGDGFDGDDAERIFRPFFTTKSSGTGLGLSICRKIVDAHGGEIHAERRSGLTVFQLLLPRQRGGDLQQKQEAS